MARLVSYPQGGLARGAADLVAGDSSMITVEVCGSGQSAHQCRLDLADVRTLRKYVLMCKAQPDHSLLSAIAALLQR